MARYISALAGVGGSPCQAITASITQASRARADRTSTAAAWRSYTTLASVNRCHHCASKSGSMLTLFPSTSLTTPKVPA
ncbi:hypothetical protein [Nocardia barduliensis]|uniref:hypothetical protein n=1 Tax=Nocardia barduliensis TaxID=2736643 RepID=UPI00157258E2|nr:hypothetical protein [Nocardia barduliensis]